MEDIARHLPIELSEHRRLELLSPQDGQLALELKRISLFESFRHWAPEAEVRQELEAAASDRWLQEKLQDPNYLLVGLWQHSHLQAMGAMRRSGERLQVMSGFAWPTGFGIAGPMLKAGIGLARLAGEEELWAFSARENPAGKAFLEANGFRYAGSMWRLNRPPHWVMVDYVRDL